MKENKNMYSKKEYPKGRRKPRECDFTEIKKKIRMLQEVRMISNVRYCLKSGKLKIEIPVGLSKCLSKNISPNI